MNFKMRQKVTFFNDFNGIYKNKKVLITGNTGFKGSWLSIWLLSLGAEVYGISNSVPSAPSHFRTAALKKRITHYDIDIRDFKSVLGVFKKVQPDFVFHLAAQPLVRYSYQEPLLTLETNFIGTTHILEALRVLDNHCIAVFITSDKAYDNQEWPWGYRETDSLGGKDPYSGSKGAAELAINSYTHSFFQFEDSKIKIAVGRAGNVIGGGDWALDRIVPDCIAAWAENKSVDIRSPHATRPWQHVLEPLSGYLSLGEQLAFNNNKVHGEAFNFGPSSSSDYTVAQLISEMKKGWRNVEWNDVSKEDEKFHEANLLKLCCEKALYALNWVPVLNFQDTVRFTVDWYREFYENPKCEVFEMSLRQIKEYILIGTEKPHG
jgi:CDP-glucose 4,6-dehydratase